MAMIEWGSAGHDVGPAALPDDLLHKALVGRFEILGGAAEGHGQDIPPGTRREGPVGGRLALNFAQFDIQPAFGGIAHDGLQPTRVSPAVSFMQEMHKGPDLGVIGQK